MMRVLDLAHEAIIDDTPATKRDIYYKDVLLFRNQRTVNSLVDDIAATLTLQRSDLNIRAASKGLVAGAGLVVHLHSDDVLRINDTEGTLIPPGEEIKALVVDPSICWVLIVEKEAVFQTLCRLRLTDHPSLPRGLMLTGKGYPDIATRYFVRSLGDLLPARIPILAMVDGDPYGIDILSVYKFGSRGLQHEKSATDRIIWLGLRSSELAS
ncbi:Meiotic recombination protein rec12 [Termitomyces sp. J132]|nr:Meiotic recombination protein rec12 [Termitomyces sp. J132]